MMMWKVFLFSFLLLQTTELYAVNQIKTRLVGYELDFVLDQTKSLEPVEKKSQLEHFQILQFYTKEASELKQVCSQKKSISYENTWEKVQVKRTILASLQAEVFKEAGRSLATLAQKMNLDRDGYQNAVKNIISYCSENMTIVSHKRLKKELLDLYSEKSVSQQFLTKESSFFSNDHKNTFEKKNMFPKLFVETAEVIKTACSWSGDPEQMQGIHSLIGDLTVASYIIDRISMGKRAFDTETKKLVIEDHQAPRIYCDDFICRQKDWIYFFSKTPKSLGYDSLKDDYRKLYCQEFYGQQKNMSVDKKNLVTQLHHIFLGVPNFPLMIESQSEFDLLIESSFNQRLSNWSEAVLKEDIQSIFLEESLELKLIPRKRNLSTVYKDIEVHFDLNYGEMDRTVEGLGKISAFVEATLGLEFIKWARVQWAIHQTSPNRKKDPIIKSVEQRISSSLKTMSEKLDLRITYGSLARQVSIEILDQLTLGYGRLDQKETKVKIVLSYSPFALRYLRERRARESSHQIDMLGQNLR